MNRIAPVIGSSTHLWPGQTAVPKPFLPLVGVPRCLKPPLCSAPMSRSNAPPVVVTGTKHLDHVEAQLVGAPGASVIVEPSERNTAAALAMVPAVMAGPLSTTGRQLCDARPRDGQGNIVVGRAELIDSRNVLAESDGPRISVIGLDDVIVVVDGDEVLVTSAAGAQLVGKLAGAANQ